MSATKKVSLAELMGKSGAQGGIELSRLHEVLGDKTPELPRNPVGRHRLITALAQRFGPNFRNMPGVSGLMRQFDGEIDFERRLAQLKQIKYVPTPKKKGK